MAAARTVILVCPVCGRQHAVAPAHLEVAYGRQLTCSCKCELERRRRLRQRLFDVPAQRALAET